MTEISKRHVIAVLIDNEFGALARVVELFYHSLHRMAFEKLLPHACMVTNTGSLP
ncbi:MAG: hypothetical protein ACKO46_03760 [Alphaproteobacteria bacterium]